MEITVSHEQARVPITVLHIKGNLTGNTYQQFEDTAREAIKGGAHYVLLDLTDVGYISSAGLRSLQYLLSLLPRPPASTQDAEQKGAKRPIQKSPYLKLVNPSLRALQPLQLVGFDAFFEICDDYDQAIKSFYTDVKVKSSVDPRAVSAARIYRVQDLRNTGLDTAR